MILLDLPDYATLDKLEADESLQALGHRAGEWIFQRHHSMFLRERMGPDLEYHGSSHARTIKDEEADAMDTSRNDLLGEIAADAALERSDFLVQSTEQLRKFLDANKRRIDALGGLTLIDEDPDYLSIAPDLHVPQPDPLSRRPHRRVDVARPRSSRPPPSSSSSTTRPTSTRPSPRPPARPRASAPSRPPRPTSSRAPGSASTSDAVGGARPVRRRRRRLGRRPARAARRRRRRARGAAPVRPRARVPGAQPAQPSRACSSSSRRPRRCSSRGSAT